MACDTFIKIALKCRRHFVTVQIGEAVPFIEEILSTISSIICDLQTQQVRLLMISDVLCIMYINNSNDLTCTFINNIGTYFL